MYVFDIFKNDSSTMKIVFPFIKLGESQTWTAPFSFFALAIKGEVLSVK